MARPKRPAKAEATPATNPLDNFFQEVFAAAQRGDTQRRDQLLQAGVQANHDASDETETALAGPSAVLCQNLSLSESKDRAQARTPYLKLTKPMAFVTRGNPSEHRRALAAKGEYRMPVIDVLLQDFAPREEIRIRPTIIEGAPGLGKTTLARDFCRVAGLPVTIFPAAGVNDSMFGGTSSNWSNSSPSIPVQILRKHGVANPCIVMDEIDKASQGSHNGSLLDVLVTFLDRGNASIYEDPSLGATVDCSHINWILTANDLSRVPEPLRDRCRIIRMPEPQWRHVGEVTKAILDSIADDRDIDRRWLPDLDADEIDLIGKHWRGGSIRKLRRIVETIIDVRDAHMPRA